MKKILFLIILLFGVLFGTQTILASSGDFIKQIGSPAQFYHPSGVAVDSSGNIYVADTLNYKIKVYEGILNNNSQPNRITIKGNIIYKDTLNEILQHTNSFQNTSILPGYKVIGGRQEISEQQTSGYVIKLFKKGEGKKFFKVLFL